MVAAKKAAGKFGIGVVVDLQGPKIRTGDYANPISLPKGDHVAFHLPGHPPSSFDFSIPVTPDMLIPLIRSENLKGGHRIKLDDGLVTVVVSSIDCTGTMFFGEVHYVALSFVRNHWDIEHCQGIIRDILGRFRALLAGDSFGDPALSAKVDLTPYDFGLSALVRHRPVVDNGLGL